MQREVDHEKQSMDNRTNVFCTGGTRRNHQFQVPMQTKAPQNDILILQ
jgi:hypothetical protein